MVNEGRVTQVIGPVVDIRFDKQLPELRTAIEIERKNDKPLVVEVAQHLGDDDVFQWLVLMV